MFIQFPITSATLEPDTPSTEAEVYASRNPKIELICRTIVHGSRDPQIVLISGTFVLNYVTLTLN
jgi:hypothetical protein